MEGAYRQSLTSALTTARNYQQCTDTRACYESVSTCQCREPTPAEKTLSKVSLCYGATVLLVQQALLPWWRCRPLPHSKDCHIESTNWLVRLRSAAVLWVACTGTYMMHHLRSTHRHAHVSCRPARAAGNALASSNSAARSRISLTAAVDACVGQTERHADQTTPETQLQVCMQAAAMASLPYTQHIYSSRRPC
jgi:hypothetical protein